MSNIKSLATKPKKDKVWRPKGRPPRSIVRTVVSAVEEEEGMASNQLFTEVGVIITKFNCFTG